MVHDARDAQPAAIRYSGGADVSARSRAASRADAGSGNRVQGSNVLQGRWRGNAALLSRPATIWRAVLSLLLPAADISGVAAVPHGARGMERRVGFDHADCVCARDELFSGVSVSLSGRRYVLVVAGECHRDPAPLAICAAQCRAPGGFVLRRSFCLLVRDASVRVDGGGAIVAAL